MTNTTTAHHIKYLESLGPCSEAIEYARKFDSLQQAWDACERGDWMLWLLGHTAGEIGSASRKHVVFIACQCARLALKHVSTGEERPLRAIETAEAYVRGEATLSDVRSAATAAYAANVSLVAVAAVAFAAAAATYADATADAYYATYGDAAAYATYADATATAVADAAAAANVSLVAVAAVAFAAAQRIETLRMFAEIVRLHHPIIGGDIEDIGI